MNEDEVVAIMRQHIEGQFPKRCNTCGRCFESLAEYLRGTRHLGEPVSYDADDSKPVAPIGTFALSVCTCGTSLAIGTDGMALTTMWRLLGWGRREVRRRGITMSQLLAELRDRIDREVLGEAARPPT